MGENVSDIGLCSTEEYVMRHSPRILMVGYEKIVFAAGGTLIECKTGHSFIKEARRKEDADYGGEMSAHHHFKKFSYCDPGILPWLLVATLLSTKNKSLTSLVKPSMDKFPCNGEINRNVKIHRA